MGLSHSPRIVTDGLVFCVDAANKRSYPGAGTAWTDLTANKNNGTLINSPSFNSANGGSIVFDGTNDYVNCGNSNIFDMSTEVTLTHWVKYTGSTWSPFIGKYTSTYENNYKVWIGADRQFDVQLSSNDSYKPLFTVSSSELPTNSWCFLGVRFKNDGTLSGFFNGIKKNTVTKSIGATNNGSFVIGSDNFGDNVFGGGEISCIQLYNRALTDEEIKQNYLATKGRFQ